MPDERLADLEVVDATSLPEPVRSVLRPGDRLRDRAGRSWRLPRWFYEIPSWEAALAIRLSPSFSLWEFVDVDVREASVLRQFPRYVPLAVTALAAHLEILRREVGTYVHVAANGGYRSPAHRLSDHASPHLWGTAANLYRIGDDLLDTRETIERYAERVREVLPAVWIRPFGHEAGLADDHLHLDIGHPRFVPRDAGHPDPPEGT